jgi:hypothetical protein
LAKPQPAFLWSQAKVTQAALDLANLTLDYSDFAHIGPTLDSHYSLTNCGTTGYAPPVNPGNHCPPPGRWWDDNGIVMTVLLQASAQLGESRGPNPPPTGSYLQKIQNLWPFIRAGQFPPCGNWPGGGMRENENPPPDGSFDLVSTAATGVVDQGLEQLYLATNASDPQHSEYKNFILANDATIKAKIRAPRGLYWAGYRPDDRPNEACPEKADPYLPPPPPGQAPPTKQVCVRIPTNAQGYMIASDVLLYQITNDPSYLDKAQQTADASLNYYKPLCSLWFQTPIWIADYFTGLFQLDKYRPDPRIRCSLEAYLNCAEQNARDKDTNSPTYGLFNKGNIAGLHPNEFGSLEQAAFVIMYSLLATGSKSDDCISVPAAWSALMKAYTARDSTTYAAALQCLRADIPFGGTAEVSNGVSIGHFCSGANDSITGPFPTGTAIACVNLPNGVVAYTDNFATCTLSCGIP